MYILSYSLLFCKISTFFRKTCISQNIYYHPNTLEKFTITSLKNTLMGNIKTILVVEDDFLLQWGLKNLKPENVNLLQARTCKQAREIFERNKRYIDVIAFDGIMDRDDDIITDEPLVPEDMTTLKLIHDIRKEFNWVMIAMSSKNWMLEQQIKAGCDLQLDDKMKLFELIANMKKWGRK